MDRVEERKATVKALAEELARLTPDEGPVRTFRIFDDEHAQYLLYTVGWEGDFRSYGCFFRVHVQPDGKVYIEHDGTDLVIADLLIERGIPKEELILAWHEPELRPLTGYGVT